MNRKLAVLAGLALVGCGSELGQDQAIGSSLAALGTDTNQFNFESGLQGWSKSGRQISSLATSKMQVFLGNQSMALNFKTGGGASTQQISVATNAQLAGATITFHVYLPTGMKVSAVQGFAQESTGRMSVSGAAGLTFGAWNTLSLTIPANAAPMQLIGVQYSMAGKWTGTAFVDSIGWTASAPIADAGSVADAGTPVADAGAPVADAGTSVFDAGTPGVAQCLRIMPLGDSITLGMNGGYRNELWNSLRALGCGVNFVGTQPDEYAIVPDPDNEGHPGWNTWDLGQGIPSFITAKTPDYVLLMIGTNDIAWWSVETADEVAARHATDLDLIQANRPGVWIVVSSIPPISEALIPPYDRSRVQFGQEYNAAIKTRVLARIAAGQKLVWMDGYSLLTVSDLYDGVHPDLVGHGKLAAGWFNALQPIINCSGAAPVCPY